MPRLTQILVVMFDPYLFDLHLSQKTMWAMLAKSQDYFARHQNRKNFSLNYIFLIFI